MLCLQRNLAASEYSARPWIATPQLERRRRRRYERKEKRGKRRGIRARLAASPHSPAILSILMANVRSIDNSLDNKMDNIRLIRSTQSEVRECCVYVFMETWINDNIPDSAIQLNRLTCYRLDRATVSGGKTRSGGVIVYISDAWCRVAVVVCKHCSEYFHLPREINAILLLFTSPQLQQQGQRSGTR